MTIRAKLGSALADRVANLPPPVVVFNKSHSGSRLLALLLLQQSVFMGGQLNESLDSLPLLKLVEWIVAREYPSFAMLRRPDEWPQDLQNLIGAVLDAHLAGWERGQPWGWKLCETVYVLPLVAALFPDARFVHLIRDGRDVAFSDHVSPELPFWRKVYFGTDAIRSWRGMPLDNPAYVRKSHLYNAQHWQESVTLGRHYGVMLGPSYHEIYYEQLCATPFEEGRKLMVFLGLKPDDAALAATATNVLRVAVAKYRREPVSKQKAVQRLIEPTLLAFGYACEPLPPTAVELAQYWPSRVWRALKRRVIRS